MPVRSPLTAYGNVRVGPPAMPLICTKFFFDCICTVKEMELEPNKPLKAEQEGAFFSSESAEKNRTGWVGLSVSLKLHECQPLTDGSA